MSQKDYSLGFSLNPLALDVSGGTPQLSPGNHKVVISDADKKGTKASGGGMLVLELSGIDESRGESGVYRLNLWNQSEQASRIANGQLGALCMVCGHTGEMSDIRAIFNKPFIVEVRTQANDERYTEIKSVRALNGQKPEDIQREIKNGGSQQGGGFGGGQQTGQQNTGGFGAPSPQAGGFGAGNQTPAQDQQTVGFGGGGFNAGGSGGGFGQQAASPERPTWG